MEDETNNNMGMVAFQLSDGRVIMIPMPDEVLTGLLEVVMDGLKEAGIECEVAIGTPVQVDGVDGTGPDSYTEQLRNKSRSMAYL